MFNFPRDSEAPAYFLPLAIPLVFLLTIIPVQETLSRETIDFSGYTWHVKNSVHGLVGPGPNHWSGSGRNLVLDESGDLRLRIDEHKGCWYATEIRLDKTLGYGTYRFTVDFPNAFFDKNVVFGLFNYLNDQKEFDIEISHWGQKTSTNASFAVQPAGVDHNLHRFSINLEQRTKKVFSFTWSRDGLTFRYENCDTSSCDQSTVKERWQYKKGSVPDGDLKTHINLWLVDGNPPTDGEEVEVVLEDFSFVPL